MFYFEADHVHIKYNPGDLYIHTHHIGFQNLDTIKETSEVINQILLDHKVKFEMSDQRQIKGSFSDATGYVNEIVIPKFRKLGLIAIGTINSSDIFQKVSMSQLMETAKKNHLNHHAFNSIEACIKWFEMLDDKFKN